jgi:hypothetical protein
MKSRKDKEVSTIEFAFSLLVFVPLMLGTGSIGINMVRSLQTIQLARDAGHMYARGVDFSQPGNKTILGNLGSTLGLSTAPGEGEATVILTALAYIDKNACAAAGAADAAGNPNGACVNFQKWVIAQRIVLGNADVRGSNYGVPVTTGDNGVAVDPNNGKISAYDQARRSGAQAQFSGFNPYSVVNGVAQGLPSGQHLYVAEAAAKGFSMPPFVSGAPAYSWGIF